MTEVEPTERELAELRMKVRVLKHRIRFPTIEAEWQSGMTLKEIGDKYGFTREYVRQILTILGHTAADGGQAIRSEMKVRERDARYKARWGISREEMMAIPARARIQFSQFRRNHRAAGWELTIGQWWHLWVDSDRWEQGGRGIGKYAIGRIDKTLPWKEGNVAVMEFTDAQRMGQGRSTAGRAERLKAQIAALQAQIDGAIP